MSHFKLLAREPSGIGARLRDNNFDALRLIFASMVVLFHLGLLTQSDSLKWLYLHVSATFAVQAFFVVSGFLVTMSYVNSASALQYAEKRARRIAPAYITVVVIAALILSLLSTLPLRAYFGSGDFWRYVGYNLVLANFRAITLPGVFASNPEHAVNGSLWTIKIEVGFYLSVPVMVWAVRRFGYRRVIPAAFAASLAWHLGFEWLSTDHHGDMFDRIAKQLPGQMSFFLGGAWAYYRALDGRAPRAWAAILGLIAYAVTSDAENTSPLNWALAPFAATALVSWAALAGPRLPRVGKHGDFSYGVYLYHFPIVQSLIALGMFARAPLWAAVVAVVAVAGCTFLSWHLIEQPALRRKPRLALTQKPQAVT